MIGQSKKPWITLIAFPAKDILLTDANTGILIAAHIPCRTQRIALTRLTSIGIGWIQIPKSWLASVAFLSIHVLLTDAPACHQVMLNVRASLTLAIVF